MNITYPPLIDARPGDPITSEGWNNIITAVKKLYDEHNRSNSQLTISVIDVSNNQTLKNAVITIVSENLPPITANYAAAEIQKYIVNSISPGTYNLVVEVEGYSIQRRELIVTEVGDNISIPIEMTKTVIEKKLPRVFGLSLLEASKKLTSEGFLLTRIIDSHGTEIVPANIKERGVAIKVLNQVPAAGLPYKIGGSVELLVSAKAAFEERVKVPDLTGLSLNEARIVLEDIGLVLGETKISASK